MHMADIRFAWNPTKAAANKRKHRVSFSEAQTVFYDEEALLLDDPDHSGIEDRFLLLGLSARLRVLLVVHSYRDEAETIRIISARKANPGERSMYEKRRKR
jgi:uncharacterized DUF497 family protein